MKALNYRHTITACCLSSVTMAATNNLAPLLFLIFHESFGIPLAEITLLVTVNFVIQLTVDLLAALFADRVGYRPLIVLSALLSAVGLLGLGSFPFLFSSPWLGLLLADVLYSFGSGLGEALISPLVEACPTRNKAAMMGFLHSFYCWGTVLVILLSTLFLLLAGKGLWWLLPLLWSLLPLLNTLALAVVPLPPMEAAAASPAVPSRPLWRRPLFWVFLGVMMAAGASELSMHQWASAFAEAGLGVPKAVGDLAGPCLYAALMGTARVFFARMSDRIDLRLFLLLGGTLGTLGYLLAALSPLPALSLVGCGITGLSVGMLWPGALSLAAARLRDGSTLLFSLCALFGDLGCSLGPTAVGLIAAALG
ncbi:MAG: MFS transporter, partial [Clostridia bacterium]|nr:MFS transporter [Clostridia bacterium]